MSKKLFIALFSLVVICASFAGWEKFYGGCAEDLGYSVAQTTDGGYVAAGYSDSYSPGENNDFYLVRVNSDGDTLWTRTYGGDETEWCYSVAQTFDGGFIMTGRTYSFSVGGGDIYIVKTDSIGDTMWTRSYGGTYLDEACYVATTSGGYIISGYSDSYSPSGYFDFFLMKLDESGDSLWMHTYGGELDDGGFAGAGKTFDGGYVITGKTNSFGAPDGDVYLVKTNNFGIMEWELAYGGSGNDEGWSVVEMYDGGFVIAGLTDSYGAGENDVYVIRVDEDGDTVWTRTYGTEFSDCAQGIVRTYDGNLAVVGTISIHDGENWYDIWLLILDSSTGDTLWTKTYGGGEDDLGQAIAATEDNGFIITGWTNSFSPDTCSVDLYLIKTDSLGNVDWVREAGGKPEKLSLNAFPNPFNSSVAITAPAGAEVEIYDLRGGSAGSPTDDSETRSLSKVEMNDTRTFIWTPDETNASGLYLVKARTEDGNYVTKRIVLIK